MKSWGYGITATALYSIILVLPAGAAPQQEQQEQVPAQAQQSSARAEQPKARGSWDSMGIRGFSVALVLGDLAGASTPDNLPTGAKKALSDMRDFLPYKSYRLLDTHWILCCSGGSASSVAGRLRGVEDDEYSFTIHARASNDWSDLAVSFNLRETSSAAEHLATAASAERQAVELRRQREELERRSGQGSQADQAAARAQYEELKRKMAEFEFVAQTGRATTASGRMHQLLDSTFSMKVGETVVIGTSRLKGDKALIALLTAASRNSTPPRER